MPSSTSTSELPPPVPARGVVQVVGGLAAGALAALLLLELLFRLLPVATSTQTGYYFDPLLLTYPAHHRFTSATGWELQNARRNEANNFGYLADHDFVRDPDAIALIGDSFVEGSMLAPPDRFAARLEARLGGKRAVYAMGSPGTALLDYAERIRFAADKFGIHDFVLLLEHADVAQSLCGSGNVQAQCLDPKTFAPRLEKQSEPSAMKRMLRKSALAQYLFSQLKLDPARWLHSLVASKPAAAPTAARDARLPSEAIERVIDAFFERVAPYRNGGKLVLVMPSGKGDEVDQQLSQAARQHEATFIEAKPFMQAETARTGLSMHVSPRDAHLNGLAFGVISDLVAPEVMTKSAAPPAMDGSGIQAGSR